jgi:hypothetical protein
MLAAIAAPASAAFEKSLANSEFEIDSSANLKVEVKNVGSLDDWASVVEAEEGENRLADDASGPGDNAFGQGSKEDTEEPSIVSGSIPPNKSDLKTFGIYAEDVNGGEYRFLHLFWHRVQDPSGSTNMDFELNQGTAGVSEANGETLIRVPGDLLIQYDLANGGTVPELFKSVWLDGTEEPPLPCEASNKYPCWSAKKNLTLEGDASGSINLELIEDADSDGLGPMGPRTFGEATIDFNALTEGSGRACTSFGWATLKSRSSDSFSSSLKDFIGPLKASLNNCAELTIRKVDDTGATVAGATFEVWENLGSDDSNFNDEEDGLDPLEGETDRRPNHSCTTEGASGECTIEDVLPGFYWIVEVSAPLGYTLPEGPCNDVPKEIGTAAKESIECEDPREPASILVEKQDDAGAALNGAEFTLYTDNEPVGTFNPAPDGGPTPDTPLTMDSVVKKCTTATVTINDEDVSGVCAISGILPDALTSAKDPATSPPSYPYCLNETGTPSDHDPAAPQCFWLGLGEDLTVADDRLSVFVDNRHKGAIKITKTRKHAAADGGSGPHSGVKFTVTGGNLASGIDVTTDSKGEACVDGLVVSSLVGDYTVTETLPDNYVADGPLAKTVSVTKSPGCTSPDPEAKRAAVAFSNTPLTDIEVKVTSLVTGGTRSKIDCVSKNSGDWQENPSLKLPGVQPGTYICTIVVDP